MWLGFPAPTSYRWSILAAPQGGRNIVNFPVYSAYVPAHGFLIPHWVLLFVGFICSGPVAIVLQSSIRSVVLLLSVLPLLRLPS